MKVVKTEIKHVNYIILFPSNKYRSTEVGTFNRMAKIVERLLVRIL